MACTHTQHMYNYTNCDARRRCRHSKPKVHDAEEWLPFFSRGLLRIEVLLARTPPPNMRDTGLQFPCQCHKHHCHNFPKVSSPWNLRQSVGQTGQTPRKPATCTCRNTQTRTDTNTHTHRERQTHTHTHTHTPARARARARSESPVHKCLT